MKANRKFEIAWQALPTGLNSFVYSIDNEYMKAKDHKTDVSNWDIKISLFFDKREDISLLKFDIDGKIKVPCDRCGDEFELQLWDEFVFYGKYTKDTDESGGDNESLETLFLDPSEPVINIENLLYENLLLSLPLQRLHPTDANGNSMCNPVALRLLNQLNKSEPEESTNSLMEGLKKIKIPNKSN
ncbi:MAG: hypothetical protein EBX41_08310 [Chitinophagia bacterium]|nr:hypothetical protein [Chitinophagia bacterium]